MLPLKEYNARKVLRPTIWKRLNYDANLKSNCLITMILIFNRYILIISLLICGQP